MPKVAAPRTRRSKEEVAKEYSKIATEVSELRGAAGAKAAELDRARGADVRRSVEGLSVESVVQKINAVNLEISKSLSELSQKLVAEVENLKNVREAVNLETKDLERLHKIDIAVGDIGLL